jgi:Tol biopolymer transport system component
MKKSIQISMLGLLVLLGQNDLFAQYFGRNKPGYEVFNYDVYSTPNFEIYHYLDNDSIVKDLALKSEQWYNLHQNIFKDTLDCKNPIIFYENHGDFQQTNVIRGMISVGTGGFTEGLKNRVVMPVSQTGEQTDHILGHELVHAFQYNYLLNTSGLSLQDLSNIPLWMIEGMAEYLSIGSVDPNTAMWLRDDVLNNSLPTLSDMSRMGKYNPYRYGQAFWAFTAKTWGDQMMVPMLSLTAKVGYQKAIEQMLGVSAKPAEKAKKKKGLFGFLRKKNKEKSGRMDADSVHLKSFDSLWHATLNEHYLSVMADTSAKPVGELLFDEKNAGSYNFSPVISPNGEYVIFMSEKELFSIDLFLARVSDGKILGTFTKRVNENEIDAFNFIESTGTWSPDSRFFAYSVYKKGKNVLLVIDAKSRKVVREIAPGGLRSLNNPVWGPDGKIAFSAQSNGITDIYVYGLNDGSIKNITMGKKSSIQPSWSHSGSKLAFITEKGGGAGSKTLKYFKNIAIYDLVTGSTEILDVFSGAANYSPLFSPDDSSIFFLSDRDGFRNLYRYDLTEGKVYQQTSYNTGIAGMTMESPAISMAPSGNMVYSYYSNHQYVIYKAHINDFDEKEVGLQELDYTAAILPSLSSADLSKVDEKLASRPVTDSESEKRFTALPYRPKFQLDYISNVNVGVSTGLISPGAAGGVSAIFSDIVGNNQLFLNLNLNGQIYDFGGVVAFMNQKKRHNYGVSVSHIPYMFGYGGRQYDTINIDGQDIGKIDNYIDLYRIFESRIMFFGFYPLSTTMRFEGAVSATRYGYRLERHSYNYYDYEGDKFYDYAGYEKEVMEAPDPMGYFSTDLAFVLDNSHFGLTAPLKGARSRIQVSKNYGYYDYFTTLVDARKYYFNKPVGLAFRLLNYNRLGTSADKNVYNSLYLGYPWYIRGYESSTLNRRPEGNESTLDINQLSGSKMVVANAEVRIPFTGPKKLTLLGSKILYSDLNFFVDAGLIWDNKSTVAWKWSGGSMTERIPLVSTGVSLRVNVFGYIILEPYYAFPFQFNREQRGVFGLNFVPGW